MPELEVKAVVKIPEGKHAGTVTKLDFRHEPYEYTDVFIKVDDAEGKPEIKAGYSTNVSEQSELGKLLTRFGAKLVPGTKIDPEKILLGKKCSFVTMDETSDKGTFARIVPSSVKLA
jgi:hypothetical protein